MPNRMTVLIKTTKNIAPIYVGLGPKVGGLAGQT